MAYAIAHRSWQERAEGQPPVNAFSVRKEAKARGAGKRMEGSFSPGSRVVVIEDVITSGGSALRACEAVEAEGGEVLAVLALVDRAGGGREAIEAAGYRAHTLSRSPSCSRRHPSRAPFGYLDPHSPDLHTP